MRIRYLKNHHPFRIGEETESDNADFLIRYKIAEEVAEPKEYVEKLEIISPKARPKGNFKEKRENKTGNVPTAVSMKSVKKAK